MENNTTFEQLTDEEEIEAYKGDQYVFYRPQKKYEVFSTSFGKYYGFVFGEGTFEGLTIYFKSESLLQLINGNKLDYNFLKIPKNLNQKQLQSIELNNLINDCLNDFLCNIHKFSCKG